jgi:hypothetical protein
LPRLKLKVEYAIIGYLIGELTDVEFKARIQSILDEFEGKALLHRNIGQLVLEWEKQNRALQHKFIEIWGLLEQISPQIKEGSKSREDAKASGDHHVPTRAYANQQAFLASIHHV